MSVTGWLVFTAVFLLVFGPILKALALNLLDFWAWVKVPPWERDERTWTREETQAWLNE